MSRRDTDREPGAPVVVTVKAPQQGTGPSVVARYMSESNLHAELEGPQPRPLFTASEDAIGVEAAGRLLSDLKGGPRRCDVIHLTLITSRGAFDALGDSEEARRAGLRAATRATIAEVERALGFERLRWVAAAHRNTDEPHVHVAVGRDAVLAEGSRATRIEKLAPELLPKRAGADGGSNDGLIARTFSASLTTSAAAQHGAAIHPAHTVELAGGAGGMMTAAER
jgi:hypothetical protein